MTWQAYVFFGLFLYCFSYLFLDDFLFALNRKPLVENTVAFLAYLPIIILSNCVWDAGKRMSQTETIDLNVIDLNERRIMRK